MAWGLSNGLLLIFPLFFVTLTAGQETLSNDTNPVVVNGIEPKVTLLGGFVVFFLCGLFSAAVAFGYKTIRRTIYGDDDILDTAFTAGGSVSVPVTASTIVSHWTWSATLLQSCTVAGKFGISGPYWYAGGAAVQIVLFAILSIQLKIRAPGAKTFLQVIKARFGTSAHLVYCVFAFFTNIIVVLSLLLGGTTVLTSLIQNLSLEMASLLIAAIIASYTIFGGLGATFYVCYFNAAFIFTILIILVTEVLHNPLGHDHNPFGSSKSLYEHVKDMKGPPGNAYDSYLTFYSSGGFMFGVVNIVGNFGAVFCDQTYWQSSIAAKPVQGVWGFISGGISWFSIPFALATIMGMAYLGLTHENGAPLLSPEDENKGLILPLVIDRLLGSTGAYLLVVMVLMAIMSTGSAEITALASLIIYDVYQIYVEPYRQDLKDDHCLLCARPVKPSATSPAEHSCVCQSVSKCKTCLEDSLSRRSVKGLVKPHYTCFTHGKYREYQDHLLGYKNWLISILTLLTIPLTLAGWALNLNLAWVYYFTGVLISSTVIPIALSMLWGRTNSYGMIVGAIGGCVTALIGWLVHASTLPGGLSDFITNTGSELPMLTGCCTALGVGGILCVVISLVMTQNWTPLDEEAEWDKTRDIDNPLSPWVEKYQDELETEEGVYFRDRPQLEIVIHIFRRARIIAYIAGFLFTLVFIIIWPLSMLSIGEMKEASFEAWTTFSQIWAYLAAAFIIIAPIISEVRSLRKAKSDKLKSRANEHAHVNGGCLEDQTTGAQKNGYVSRSTATLMENSAL